MTEQPKVLEGYLVDIGCIRKYPIEQLLERAHSHTRNCAMMGHCLESGYGLVGESGRVLLLDQQATPQVFSALEDCHQETGIRIRVTREQEDGQMKTIHVEVTS